MPVSLTVHYSICYTFSERKPWHPVPTCCIKSPLVLFRTGWVKGTVVCSSPQWGISGNALGLREFAGMEGRIFLFFFLAVSALGLFHPLQEVKYVPGNEIFLCQFVCEGSKEAGMLGRFCLSFGKEKCSPQIPAVLLVNEICPAQQPYFTEGREGNSSHLDRIQECRHLQAK